MGEMQKNKNIVILGWADLSLGTQQGGGYNLVAQEHALSLRKQGFNVFYLGSGLDYSFSSLLFPNAKPRIRKKSIWNGILLYSLWNSRIVAPADRNPTKEPQNNKDTQDEILIHWLQTMDIHRVFVHSLEGQSKTLMSTLKKHAYQVDVFCHDHFYICPRVSLLFQAKVPCLYNDKGTRCRQCLSTEYVWLYKMKRFIRGFLKSKKKTSSKIITKEKLPATTIGNKMLLYNLKEKDWGKRNTHLMAQLNRVDRVFVPSHFLGDTLLASGLKKEKLHITPIGLPHLDALREESEKKQKRSNPYPLRFAFKSGTAYHKGIALLLSAIEMLPSVILNKTRFLLWGIPERNQIATWDIPEEIMQLYSSYKPQDLASHRELYDIGILSHLWFENAPIAIQEHLAMKKPVISPRLGGVEDFIMDQENGWLFEPGNPEALARIIEYVVEHPEVIPSDPEYNYHSAKSFFQTLE